MCLTAPPPATASAPLPAAATASSSWAPATTPSPPSPPTSSNGCRRHRTPKARTPARPPIGTYYREVGWGSGPAPHPTKKRAAALRSALLRSASDRSAGDGQVDLFHPLGEEDRLAVGPAGRRRRCLADRLQQRPAPLRMQVRKRRGRAERAWQPGPDRCSDQPFVEEPVGGEVRKTVLTEVEGGDGDQRPHHRLHLVEAAVVRHMRPYMVEAAVDALLCANAGGLAHVARPAAQRIAATKSDVERAADVALRRRGKGRELLHLHESK